MQVFPNGTCSGFVHYSPSEVMSRSEATKSGSEPALTLYIIFLLCQRMPGVSCMGTQCQLPWDTAGMGTQPELPFLPVPQTLPHGEAAHPAAHCHPFSTLQVPDGAQLSRQQPPAPPAGEA